MDDIDVLESVLRKDEALLANVRPEQYGDPTPCPDYDVRTLANHLAGFVQLFAAGVNQRTYDGDVRSFTTDDPAGEFRRGADDMLHGWRSIGIDPPRRVMGGEMPGDAVLSVVLMEYVTHGCDLAIATGQPVPFTDDELRVTLDRARRTLPPDQRSAATIDTEIPVPDDAPALDRLLGFMGRRPFARSPR